MQGGSRKGPAVTDLAVAPDLPVQAQCQSVKKKVAGCFRIAPEGHCAGFVRLDPPPQVPPRPGKLCAEHRRGPCGGTELAGGFARSCDAQPEPERNKGLGKKTNPTFLPES